MDEPKEFPDSPAGADENVTDTVVTRNIRVRRERIAHYEILAPLGVGGMGEVFLARDSRLGRQVALKLLTSVPMDNETRLWRFRQEARAVSALNHPNIVTIFELGEFDRDHFIAMEFVDG